MKLMDYLKENGKLGKDFAVEVGVSQGYISLLCHGKHTPSGRLARRIVEATGGQVTYEDLFPHPPPDPSSQPGPQPEEQAHG